MLSSLFINRITAAETSPVEEEPTFNYTAVYGDTYASIAKLFNTTQSKLKQLNGYSSYSNPSVKIFQQVIIPGVNPYPDSSIISATGKDVISMSQLWAIGWRQYMNDTIYQELQNTLREFEITTSKRLRHFMAHCTYDSQNGRIKLETGNGNAYEGDTSLGNTEVGDGRLFKGAGYLQIRGRTKYQAFSDYLGDSTVMTEGAQYVSSNYSWRSAGFLWYHLGLNELSDKKQTTATSVSSVLGINDSSIADRELLYQLCEKFIPAPGGDPNAWKPDAAFAVGIVLLVIAITALIVYCVCKNKKTQQDVYMRVLV